MKNYQQSIIKFFNNINTNQKKSNSRFSIYILLVFFITLTNSVLGQNALVPFKFTLNASAKTSAGVYKKDGTLIRTLWGGVTFSAGTHTKTWDRKDDEGLMVTDTGLVVKVLSNNVNYKWEGVIGNTSDSFRGPTVLRFYHRMESMAIHGNYAYFAAGYNEGATTTAKFLLSKPQNKINIFFHEYGTNSAVEQVATDGNYVYWAGFDPGGGQWNSKAQSSFTYATRVSDDAEVLFSSGIPIQSGTGRLYNAAIDVVLNNTPVGNPTGLAVQQKGKYLFVAHGNLNKINVLNKTTGAAVTSFSITNPRDLCVDGNDNLWVISGSNTVEKYTVDSASGNIASSATIAIQSLLAPLAVTVSPNNYQVLILDGDSSQQIKSFSNHSGVPLWTYGQYGGYATDPTVANDKFYFSDRTSGIGNQFIAFQPDSSFWVSDGGNERVQHFSAALNFIDNIMYMPHSYSTQVDRNDPTRAFNQFLEFKIDYSKPLAPNNGSWKLVKNWRNGVPATHIDNFYISAAFDNIITLSNGRTYATIFANKATPPFHELVELPASGNIRLTGIRFNKDVNHVIEPDGSKRIYVSNLYTPDTGYWETKQLTGFDTSNNPIWGKGAKIATVDARKPRDPSFAPIDLSFPKKTSSDLLIMFNFSLREGYHLGAVKVGDNKFLWKTAKSTFKQTSQGAGDEYQGEFPTDGSYDIGNGALNGGAHVYTLEKNIFWSYHGEFWGSSQTNMWNHVYDNGLLVSQFGITIPDGKLIDWEAAAMSAGNVFSSTIVKVGADYYLYHNDESFHSGLHRWKITGLNTIQEQSMPISYTTTNGGLLGAYFDGADMNSFNRVAAFVDSTVNLTTPPKQIKNSSNFSARWTGFVQPQYSQKYTFYTKTNKGVKLWVDGNLVITQWKNNTQTEYSSATIALVAGKKYEIQMEVSGGAASLLWSSSSQTKQIIPSTSLFPSEVPLYTNDGVDLMEGLPYRAVLEDSMYGWNRNSAQEDFTSWQQSWSVRTNTRSVDKKSPDVQMNYRSSTKSSYVTRDLGKASPCITSWKITGKLCYKDNEANKVYENNGGYFDVLDNQGKIISRIVQERLFFKNNVSTVQFKCNGVAIVDGPSNPLFLIANKPQPFEIYLDSTGITYKYANFNPIKVKLFDATSNWKQPKTIRFYFTNSTTNPNYDKKIGVQKLRFLAVAPALPEISTSGATEFCDGDSVTLTSTAASSYLWSNSATTQSIKVTNTGNYTVIVKDTKGCPLPSDTTKVIVNPIPAATITASGPTTFCQGDSVILTASKADAYLWSNSQTTKSIIVKDSGNYKVKMTNANLCSATSSTIAVNVNSSTSTPIITPSGATTFCMGDSVTLTSSSANSYLWSNNATTKSIKVKTSGSYSVQTNNGTGCSATSASTAITVHPLPPNPTITASGATTFCQGDSVTLTSSSASQYMWSNSATSQSIKAKVTGNFKVKITDVNGCSATSNSTAVTVNSMPSNPTITVTGATTFCQGDSVTLSSSSASQYLWSNNATSQSIKVKATGNFKVKITDANGCSATSTNTSVVVNTLPTNPTITASGATTFCQGDSVTLSSSSATSYLWSNNNASQSIKVKSSGNFKVKITDANGCSATSTNTSVVVNTLPTTPTITASGSTTFCQGDSVTLASSSATSYLWSNNNTSQYIKVKSSGNFNVKITDGNGCSATSYATSVTVNASPSTPIISANNATTICQGDSVILSSSSSNSYLWSNNSSSQSINVKVSGSFTVKVTNSNGCSATSAATNITVNALPANPIIASSGATTFCQGDSVTLSSSSANQYLWSNNVTSQYLKVKSAGNFYVKITDVNGCTATSASTAVTVNTLPATPTVYASGPTTLCQDDSVMLVSSSANAYSWNNNTSSQIIKVKTSGNYKVKITDAKGCSAFSATTTVSVNQKPAIPTISASGPTTFCQGSNVTLTASNNNAYLWNNSAVTQNIVVKESGNFQVKVTDANGCSSTSSIMVVKVNAIPAVPTITSIGTTTLCQGDSVILASSAANAYLWNNNAISQNIIVKNSGNYFVKITDMNGCTATSMTASVIVNSLPKNPTISANGSTTFCQGDSVILSASNASNYLWSNNITTQNIIARVAGSYQVKITDLNGCSATSNIVTVTVNNLPIAEITAPGATTFCQGGTLTLTSSYGQSYKWNTGATSASIVVSTTDNFFVTIKDLNGCYATSPTLKVKVNPLPATPVITASGPTEFCQGDSVTLSSSSASSYWWSNSAKSQNVTIKTAGDYYVIISDNNKCTAKSSMTTITVLDAPTIPVITIKGNILTSSASSGNQWYFNGTSIPGATDQTYKKTKNGTYTVLVSNSNCISSSAAYFYSDLTVGNVFNENSLEIYPNPNDGKFNIRLKDVITGTIKIYDATGKLIFNEIRPIDTEIDLSEHAYGVYSLQIQTNEKNYIGRVIIQ